MTLLDSTTTATASSSSPASAASDRRAMKAHLSPEERIQHRAARKAEKMERRAAKIAALQLLSPEEREQRVAARMAMIDQFKSRFAEMTEEQRAAWKTAKAERRAAKFAARGGCDRKSARLAAMTEDERAAWEVKKAAKAQCRAELDLLTPEERVQRKAAWKAEHLSCKSERKAAWKASRLAAMTEEERAAWQVKKAASEERDPGRAELKTLRRDRRVRDLTAEETARLDALRHRESATAADSSDSSASPHRHHHHHHHHGGRHLGPRELRRHQSPTVTSSSSTTTAVVDSPATLAAAVTEGSRWLRQATEDLNAAELLAAGQHYSHASFQAHEVVEKCFKSVLFVTRQPVVATHSLRAYAVQCMEFVPELVTLLQQALTDGTLKSLSRAYTRSRYPSNRRAEAGMAPAEMFSADSATCALTLARQVLDIVTRVVHDKKSAVDAIAQVPAESSSSDSDSSA